MASNMRKAFCAAVLVVVLLVSPGASAEMKSPPTVQDYINFCQNGGVDEGYCLGTLYGVTTVLMALGQDGQMLNSSTICSGQFISNGQMRQVFLNWAERNPKHQKTEGYLGIWSALIEAWPCPK